MHEPQSPRICFFVGPSIAAAAVRDACARIDADVRVLPPAQQGDLLRLLEHDPDHIGIVDGYFFQTPAVLHKEILYALERGVRVLGAGSIGALRAAELDVFGMEGIGEIYRLYKVGVIDGDDEVAVTHTDAADGFRALSEPLVHLRHNLRRARARNIVSARTAAAVLAGAKRLPFTERSYTGILHRAHHDSVAPHELEALRAFLRHEAVDLKRDDALLLVQTVVARVGGHQPWPTTSPIPVSRTRFFHRFQREYVGHTVAGQHVPDTLVVSFLKLMSPGLGRLLRRVALRCLAVDEALHRGIAPGNADRLQACFREQHQLASVAAFDAWLQARCMSEDDWLASLRERDLERQLLARYHMLYPKVRGTGAVYRQIVANVVARIGLNTTTLLQPPLTPGVPWEAPLLRELKLRGRFRPALEWAGPIVQWNAALAQRAPHFALVVTPARLEAWAAARWGAKEAFDQAMLQRGFTSHAEFIQVARMVYLAPAGYDHYTHSPAPETD